MVNTETEWEPRVGDLVGLHPWKNTDEVMESYLRSSQPQFRITEVQPQEGAPPLVKVRAIWPAPRWLTFSASWFAFQERPGRFGLRNYWCRLRRLGGRCVLCAARLAWGLATRVDPSIPPMNYKKGK